MRTVTLTSRSSGIGMRSTASMKISILMKLTRDVDLRIEPHSFARTDFGRDRPVCPGDHRDWGEDYLTQALVGGFPMAKTQWGSRAEKKVSPTKANG